MFRAKSALKIVVASLAVSCVLGVSAADGSQPGRHASQHGAGQTPGTLPAALVARIGTLSLGDEYLTPRGVGVIDFGLSTGATVLGVELELGYTYTPPRQPVGRCGNQMIAWRGLSTYFRRNRFVGYSYHPPARFARMETVRGLRIGDPLETGLFLYGPNFSWETHGGQRWTLRLAGGDLFGSAAGSSGRGGSITASSSIVSIGAGMQGCG